MVGRLPNGWPGECDNFGGLWTGTAFIRWKDLVWIAMVEPSKFTCILRPSESETILVQIASAETSDTTALGGKEPRSRVYTLASGVAEAARMRRLLCLYMS